MHQNTEQLLATIEVLLEDRIICRLPNNVTSDWKPFVWDTTEKPEFNAINLLKSEGWIEHTDIEVAIANWQEIEDRGTPTEDDYRAEERFDEEDYEPRDTAEFQERKQVYQELLEYILAFPETKAVKLSCHWEYSSFAILAKTDLGDWICLTSTVPQETSYFGDILVSKPELTPTVTLNSSTIAFKQQIDEIIGKLPPVTTYGHFDGGYCHTYPHQIICEIDPDEDLALQKALQSSLLLKVSQFKTFYPDPQDYLFTSYSTKEEGSELYERYQHFNSFFSHTFTELLMLDFSFWDRKHIFIVGRSRRTDPLDISSINDWVGVRLASEFSYNP